MSAFFSLGCDIFVQQDAGENLREPVGDANSKSRQALMEYLEEFIPRYKHRKAIGMWEITSELTLQGILCRDGGIFCRNMTIWHE
ncbi:MAG: hypothetical protein LBR08_08610 [Bacteroidales bacterium]|nr:hypothetical protein [Bacteroidales bacterium]